VTRDSVLRSWATVERRLDSLIDTGRRAYRARNVIIQGMVIPCNASVATGKLRHHIWPAASMIAVNETKHNEARRNKAKKNASASPLDKLKCQRGCPGYVHDRDMMTSVAKIAQDHLLNRCAVQYDSCAVLHKLWRYVNLTCGFRQQTNGAGAELTYRAA
jgi:hypothetical protein